MNSYKILVVEDEKQLARFLELELLHEGYTVTTVHDGRKALELIKDTNYDMILLDIMLPELNGIEVCRRIRAFSAIPVIMLTARDSVTDRVAGLDAGADDYLIKPFAIEELLARIRSIQRRITHSAPESDLLSVGDLLLDTASCTVNRSGSNIELTKREYDLLYFLMQNKGIVLSREKILREVWGYDYAGDTNVVDVYISYLRSKVDESFPNKLIHTQRGMGYILREDIK